MGGGELVPFYSVEKAKSFVAQYGGQMVKLDAVTDDMVLGSGEATMAMEGAQTKSEEMDHGAHH